MYFALIRERTYDLQVMSSPVAFVNVYAKMVFYLRVLEKTLIQTGTKFRGRPEP